MPTPLASTSINVIISDYLIDTYVDAIATVKSIVHSYSLSGNSGVRPLGVRRAGELGQAIT